MSSNYRATTTQSLPLTTTVCSPAFLFELAFYPLLATGLTQFLKDELSEHLLLMTTFRLATKAARSAVKFAPHVV